MVTIRLQIASAIFSTIISPKRSKNLPQRRVLLKFRNVEKWPILAQKMTNFSQKWTILDFLLRFLILAITVNMSENLRIVNRCFLHGAII